jgi:prophage antirepressor-like protein
MNTEIANVVTTEKLNEQFEFFESEDFGRLEILVINGKIYFPAIQAARTLGYKNPRDAIKKHCLEDGVVFYDGVVKSGKTKDGQYFEQVEKIKYINEGNLYRLIVKSKLPSAHKFEKWVFDEVIPSIRHTGYYVNPLHKDINNMQSSFNRISEMNARSRQGELLYSIAKDIQNELMKNTLLIKAANITTGEELLQLPEVKEKSYTAEEIANELYIRYSIDITKIMIGKIANAHNLKTEENGYFAFDMAAKAVKQVESFRYYIKAVDIIYNIIRNDEKLSKKYL